MLAFARHQDPHSVEKSSKMSNNSKSKKMVRWRLCLTFLDFPIFNDFFMAKADKIPISLSKQYLKSNDN